MVTIKNHYGSGVVCHMLCCKQLGIQAYSTYLSGLVTAVAVYRNPNTIPFCLTTDLLLNVLFL